MKQQNPYRRRPGVFYHSSGVTDVIVWAPLKESVSLEIAGSGSLSIPLQKDKWGYWILQTTLLQPGDLYRFSVDGAAPVPDPAAVSQPQGVHGPSEVVDRAFDWTDQEWKGVRRDELIIYELHIGCFTDKHDCEGVISKLPYLKELGITAIELLPVAQCPGNRNWGYDGVYPYAVQQAYGGLKAFKQLVDAAHEAGIAVLLDVVYNHFGPDGNYLECYAPYFTDKYKTPWGKALNFDDAWCDGVRNYFIENALFWLGECHVDGLRLDAVHAIWDFSAHHVMQELKEEVRLLEEKSGVHKLLIAELDLNHPRYVTGIGKGGYGLDAQWIDEFHHSVHSLLTGEQDGYYEDFGDMWQLEKAFRDSYVYDGIYSEHRKKLFGAPVGELSYSSFIAFIQNHDQIGNRALGDRLSLCLTKEQLKLAAGLLLLSPHTPLLFMGEEYGETNPFLFFTDHQDPELAEIVRKGRREEFSYFNFKDDFPDPQDPESFDKCVLSWNYRGSDLYKWYRELIQLRKTRTALLARDRHHMKIIKQGDVHSRLLIAERKGGGETLVLLFNCSELVQQMPLVYSGARLVLSSGSDTAVPAFLPGYSVIVLEV
ncbi:malto-oligosyltrehalose trehalohydrolase [Filimonas effusa]|nr:malto-oligosyltrehalose trehalohydrolase [Filimonas effusa]